MIPVITSPKARNDIKSFFHHIAKDNVRTAYRLLENIERTHELISSSPKLAPVFETKNVKLKGMRWFPVTDFPKHLIFYIETESTITIVRILHKAQNISKILT